jgi:hypothetical protein
MFARQALREVGIAPLKGFGDLEMIDDRAGGAVVLPDRGATDSAHVQQQIARGVDDRLGTTQTNYLGVKRDVGIGIFVQVLGRGRVQELIEQVP